MHSSSVKHPVPASQLARLNGLPHCFGKVIRATFHIYIKRDIYVSVWSWQGWRHICKGSLLEGNKERKYDIGFRTALCTGVVEGSGGGPIYSPMGGLISMVAS